MNQPAPPRVVYEFVTYRPENILEVETSADGEVNIRMARDNLTAQRKAFLVRELAAEGFIPEHYAYWSDSEMMGVRWSVSTDHVKEWPGFRQRAEMRARCVIAIVFSVWVAFMLAFVLRACE